MTKIKIIDTLGDRYKIKYRYDSMDDFMSSEDWGHRERLLLLESEDHGPVSDSPKIYGFLMETQDTTD